ncbi:MAG: thioesterase domain-containing protein, partial [Byssovorax sp.]
FEIARQLSASGVAPGMLVLVDTPSPYPSPAEEPHDPTSPNPADLEGDVLEGLLERAMMNRLIPADIDPDTAARLRESTVRTVRAGIGYRLDLDERREFQPKIRLFRATAEATHLRSVLQHPDFDQPDFGWRGVLSEAAVEIDLVPGDHFTVMNSPAALATFLAEELGG